MTSTIGVAGPQDLEPIKAIATATELFTAEEVVVFDDMFAGSQDGSLDDHVWLALDDGAGEIAGAAYYAPEPFSDRLWLGRERARVLLVETSGLPSFEATASGQPPVR